MSAGAVIAGEAFVRIGADIRGFKQGLAQMSSQFQAFGANIAKIGAGITAVGAAIVAPFALSAKTFINFEDAMLGVLAKTGAVESEFLQLTERAKELGSTTTFTAKQVAEGMDFMAQAGFNTTQILAGIAPVLDLARAGVIDLGRASDIVTDVSTAFGLTADEITRVADVIARTASGANTNVEQMGEAFKFVAPVAKAAGQSIEEVSAAIGLLGNVGLKGTIAGTGLATTLAKLSDPEIQAKLGRIIDPLTGIGISALDSSGNVRPLLDIMRDLGRATENLPTGNKLAIFNELFGLRTSKVALNLAGAADGIENMRNKMIDTTITAKTMADTMNSGLGGAAASATSALEGLQIAIGDAISKPLAAALKAIASVLQLSIKWVDSNQDLVLGIGLAGVALVGFGVAVTGLGVTIIALNLLIGALAGIIGALLTPIGAVVAALAIAGAATIGFAVTSQATINGVSSAFEALAGTVSQSVQGMATALAGGDMEGAAEILWASLDLIWLEGLDAIDAVWDGIKQGFFDMLDALVQKADQVLSFLSGGFLGLAAEIAGASGPTREQQKESAQLRLGSAISNVAARAEAKATAQAAEESTKKANVPLQAEMKALGKAISLEKEKTKKKAKKTKIPGLRKGAGAGGGPTESQIGFIGQFGGVGAQERVGVGIGDAVNKSLKDQLLRQDEANTLLKEIAQNTKDNTATFTT